MSEETKELDLSGIEPGPDALNQLSQKLKEQLGVSLEEAKEALSAWVQAHGDKLATDVLRIAPHDNYDKLLEVDIDKANFLKNEAHAVEHWDIHSLGPSTSKTLPDLFELMFANKAVDDGHTLLGHVYIGGGKIKHAFCQMSD